MRHLTVIQEPRPVSSVRPDPKVRGEGPLSAIELPFLWADRVIERFVPARFNPLAQTGAIANVTFLVAIVTGCLLLIWYSASVHQAWSSLQSMGFVAQLVRSLHRYSSDASMFFVMLHAVRLFAARRFSGARWLAWVTGIILVSSLWLVGWLGYWLVWDENARQIAIGSAKMIDVLPIFAEPMQRSFLTDASIQSLLFFIVFFVHMLLPLGMGIALWLHITRLNRPKFLTDKPMTAAVLAALVVVSLLVPATSGKPAHMLVQPSSLRTDVFYMLPIAISDRLSGGALWALTLVSGILAFSVPWALSRGRAAPAKVDEAKCNGCTNCAKDCPYDAITMAPRTDGRNFATVAVVDESKCVGCGICAGSCDSAGIGIPGMSQVEARSRIDRWVDDAIASEEEAPFIAFVCARSAGASFAVDPDTGACDALPGYRVMPVVCSGWVHALTIERALRHGARGVLVAGCGRTEPQFREGPRWTDERLSGARKPMLRTDKVDPSRVLHVEVGRTATKKLVEEAREFMKGTREPEKASWFGRVAIATTVVGAVLLPLATLSRATYGGPPIKGPELVVSFHHPGRTDEHCHTVTQEEKMKLPPHMRRDQICERGRAAVRLRVEIDGVVKHTSSHEPKGLRGDGPASAIESVLLSPGTHEIAIAVGDSHDPAEWTYKDKRTVTLASHGRVVVLFDRNAGFTWEASPEG